MANLSSLSPITTAATALGNLILVSPQKTVGYQPQNPPNPDGSPSTSQQPPAILFHYEGEQSATLESDITDHFIEDNSAVQDQIALRPPVITTHGFIGELNDIAPPALQIIKTLADKLLVISAYTPALTTTALIAYTEALLLYEVTQGVAQSAVAAWSSITGTNGESVIGSNGLIQQNNQTKQQEVFQSFYGYWQNRTLFTVQTPWAIFQNMAIKSLRAIQDAETKMISDFEVSFKQIRTASTALSSVIQTSAQGRAQFQSASGVNNGIQSPTNNTDFAAGLQTTGLA